MKEWMDDAWESLRGHKSTSIFGGGLILYAIGGALMQIFDGDLSTWPDFNQVVKDVAIGLIGVFGLSSSKKLKK